MDPRTLITSPFVECVPILRGFLGSSVTVVVGRKKVRQRDRRAPLSTEKEAAALTAAMLVVLPGPAMAQSFLGFDYNNDFFDRNNDFFNGFGGIDQQTGETGNVDFNSEIVNTGNNSNQCAAPLQFGNTGNLQNQQGFVQSGSEADDVEFSGSQFVFAPEQAVKCDQSVEQAAAASSHNGW
jgi:hypothetical protein